MNLPLVSLIVPVYNRQTSIEVCLKSVLNLEYTHFEVLVIDDGSTDDSLDIIRRVAATDTRIKVIVQKNSGVSVARNHGLDEAKGEWIGFIDSDDAVMPCHLDIIRDEQGSHADLLMVKHTSGQYFDGVIKLHVSDGMNKRTEHPVAATYLFNDFDPFENPFFPIWNKFFNHTLIERHHIRFDCTLSLGEDQEMLCRYLLYAGKIVHYSRPSYINLEWPGLIHLGSKLREPSDYLYNQKCNYKALCSVIPVGKGKTEWYSIHYGINRPITRIFYNYTKLKNHKKLCRGELLKFTQKEIIPFIASIDITEGNAREANVRFVRRLLLSYGARPAIIWCYIYNVYIQFTDCLYRGGRKLKKIVGNDLHSR